MKLSKAARLILVGAPGVGKGTQSERLLKRFPQLSSVSSGDLLRDNVRNKTSLGLEAQKLMRGGNLVPDAMILQLIVAELTTFGWLQQRVKQVEGVVPPPSVGQTTMRTMATKGNGRTITTTHELETNEDPAASFILDGFPRTATQAAQLDALIPVNLVVHIDTPADVVIDRIANRWIHEPSGRVYNTTFNPPRKAGRDDVTGEALTRREDDSPETWRARLRKFEETSLPLLEHYDKVGILWRVRGNTSDEISPLLFDKMRQQFGATE